MEHAVRRHFMARVAGVAGMVGVGSAMTAVPGTATAQGVVKSQLTVPLRGTIGGAAAAGTLTLNNFAAQGNKIVANATATLTDVNNLTRVLALGNIPTLLASTSCEVLDLTLGPLDLNLLGLQVHLDQVHLNISANPAGGLLGQLLCSLGNLLGGGGPLQQIISLLNRILAAL